MREASSRSSFGILRQIRSGRHPRPLSGIAITIASGCLAAGLGLGVGAAAESLAPRGSLRILGIPDEEAVVGVGLAGILWLAFLLWLWMPTLRNRTARDGKFPLHFVMTLVISAAMMAAVLFIDRLRFPGDDFAKVAVILVCIGAMIASWLPWLRRVDEGFIARTTEGKIDVRCPACDHSMAGLFESRCPECGERRTIDELMNSQR